MPRTKELEAKLQETEQQLRLFQSISRMMARETSLQDALQNTVDLVAEYLQCDSVLLYLLERAELVLCAANPPHGRTVGQVRLKLDEGLTGWVARERRLLAISREAYNDSRFKLFRDLPEDRYEAFLSAPIVTRCQVVGVLNVQHRVPHSHSGGEMEMVTTIGEQLGSLLALTQIDPVRIGEVNYSGIALAAATPGELRQ